MASLPVDFEMLASDLSIPLEQLFHNLLHHLTSVHTYDTSGGNVRGLIVNKTLLILPTVMGRAGEASHHIYGLRVTVVFKICSMVLK